MSEEFIRRKDYVSGPLTDEEKVKQREHADLWIKRILRTDPMDKDKIKTSIKNLYRVADLEEPIVETAQSTIAMAFAFGACKAILDKRYEDKK